MNKIKHFFKNLIRSDLNPLEKAYQKIDAVSLIVVGLAITAYSYVLFAKFSSLGLTNFWFMFLPIVMLGGCAYGLVYAANIIFKEIITHRHDYRNFIGRKNSKVNEGGKCGHDNHSKSDAAQFEIDLGQPFKSMNKTSLHARGKNW